MDKYINGSDLLVNVGGKAVGHSTSCQITLSSETKDRAVKPLSSLPSQSGLWKDKGVTGLSVSVSADGLRVAEETENGFIQIAPDWGKGSTVEVEVYDRGNTTTPILKGDFIITSLEITGPAQDDTTYSVSLENAREPEVYPGKTAQTGS